MSNFWTVYLVGGKKIQFKPAISNSQYLVRSIKVNKCSYFVKSFPFELDIIIRRCAIGIDVCQLWLWASYYHI